jgi:hypothetical protein
MGDEKPLSKREERTLDFRVSVTDLQSKLAEFRGNQKFLEQLERFFTNIDGAIAAMGDRVSQVVTSAENEVEVMRKTREEDLTGKAFETQAEMGALIERILREQPDLPLRRAFDALQRALEESDHYQKPDDLLLKVTIAVSSRPS